MEKQTPTTVEKQTRKLLLKSKCQSGVEQPPKCCWATSQMCA